MIGNTKTDWGWPAKWLHWIGAILILLLLGHGWWMTHLAPRPDRLAHYAGHAGLGYDLLALLIIRQLWRWTHAVPELPAELATWERLSAKAGHYGLYLLMFASTLTGWALAGTFSTPLNKDAFGIPVPSILISKERATHQFFEHWHEYLSYALALLVVIHILAALRHHLIKHTDVLRRMWFGVKRLT
jgi:cytochrome b561